MPHCSLILLARAASLDSFTSAVSIHDVAEILNIEAQQLPIASEEVPAGITPFGWVVIALFRRDGDEDPKVWSGRVAIVSPKGREFYGQDATIDLQTSALARVFSMIPVFPYTGDGDYVFRAEVKLDSGWEPAKECSVPIKFVLRSPSAALPGTGLEPTTP